MIRIVLAFIVAILLPSFASAQATKVNQGTPAADSSAWPTTTVVAGAAVDPREVTVQNPTIAVTGPLTDAQLRAVAVPVSGTFWQATQPVSLADNAARLLGQVTFSSPQHIVCDSGCGSPPATADNSAFTFGTTSVSPIGYVVDDTAPNAIAEDSFGAPRMTTNRIPYADLSLSGSNTNSFKVDFGGAAQPVSGTFWQATQPVSGPLTDAQLRAVAVPVSGTFWQATQPVSGTFWQATQPVSGTVTANAGTNLNTSALALESGGNLATVASAVVAEDVASANGDNGVRAMAIRKATPADTSGTDGDNEQLQISAGRLWTSSKIDTALPAGTANIGDVDIASLPTLESTGTLTHPQVSAVLVGPITTLNYRVAYIQLTGTWSGSVSVGCNNAGGTSFIIAGVSTSSLGNSSITSMVGTGMYVYPIACKFVTLFFTSTSGTVVADVMWSQIPDHRVVTFPAQLPGGFNNIGDVDVVTLVPGVTATSLGKAEDAAAASGDTGVAVLLQRKDTNATLTSADGDYVVPAGDNYGATFVRSDHPNRIRCTVTVSTAVVITAVGGSCVAPGAGLSIYITDIEFSASASAIGADAFPTLKYGTGGTCGTGTTVFWGALTAAAIRTEKSYMTPLKIPANNEVCWISTTAGSKFLVLSGYIAP